VVSRYLELHDRWEKTSDPQIWDGLYSAWNEAVEAGSEDLIAISEEIDNLQNEAVEFESLQEEFDRLGTLLGWLSNYWRVAYPTDKSLAKKVNPNNWRYMREVNPCLRD
jgi:hypothetical protein